MKKIYPLLVDSITPESIIKNGFLKDNTIDDLIETYLGNLLGDKVFNFFQGNLPITVQIKGTAKDLCRKEESSGNKEGCSGNKEGCSGNKSESFCNKGGCSGNMRITVSPDDETALPRYGCWGKERMLYILDADKDSSIWIGFEKSLSATEIYERCQKGSILEAMNEIAPEEGETFYIAPGVPLCIGKGVKYLEVAQNSPVELDITDLDQLVEALDFIHLDAYIPEYIAPESCLFRLERIAITKPQTIAPDQTESFMAILNLDNQTSLTTRELRVNPEVNEENFVILSPIANSDSDGIAKSDSDGINTKDSASSLVMIPHDISSLTIAPVQDGDYPTASFLRIYMCNIPELIKDEDDTEEDEHHSDNHGHNDNCGCGHHYN